MTPELIDTHAHLHGQTYANEIEQVVERAKQTGVLTMVTIGTSVPDSREAVQLADKFPGVYASLGVHPDHYSLWDKSSFNSLKEIALQNPKVVAIGETGLDFFHHKDEEARKQQAEVFRQHIQLARKLHLPLIIHSREAHPQTLQVLREEKAGELGGIIHCFTSDWEAAKDYLDLGFMVALGGIITFGKKAAQLEDTAKKLPEDRIILETDCPYLAPAPFRGKRNEPAYVRQIAEKLAGLRMTSLEKIAESTTANAKKVFSFNRG